VDPLVELEKVAMTDFEFYMHRESTGACRLAPPPPSPPSPPPKKQRTLLT
jgi:hypothetical protein